MPVFVFGHRNPDTDAICAAISYADYLQKTTRPDAIAACCGAPNKRTEYALKVAGLAPPRIIMDVRPEVGDVCERNPVTGRNDQVFYEIYESMKSKDLRALPILDENGKFVGLLTLLDLLKVACGLLVVTRFGGKVTEDLGAWGYKVVRRTSKSATPPVPEPPQA